MEDKHVKREDWEDEKVGEAVKPWEGRQSDIKLAQLPPLHLGERKPRFLAGFGRWGLGAHPHPWTDEWFVLEPFAART